MKDKTGKILEKSSTDSPLEYFKTSKKQFFTEILKKKLKNASSKTDVS